MTSHKPVQQLDYGIDFTTAWKPIKLWKKVVELLLMSLEKTILTKLSLIEKIPGSRCFNFRALKKNFLNCLYKMCKNRLIINIFSILITTSFCNIFASENTGQTLNYNKSWIHIDASNNGQQLVSGQIWQVPVEYYIDPSEFTGETTLYLWGTGPWIDTPDGKYTTKRGHISYPKMSRQVKLKQPGKGQQIFSFTVPKGLELVKKNNPVLLISGFRDNTGKDWPWEIRETSSFIDNSGFFDIETDVP